MKVKELIAKLQEFDGELDIAFTDLPDCFYSLDEVDVFRNIRMICPDGLVIEQCDVVALR